MGREKVETIAVSLVREYLSRKGFRQSLKTLDKEFPRTEDSINNRITLAKEMHIERLMRRNKELSDPFRTMIEVVVAYVTERRSLNGVTSNCKGIISTQSEEETRAAESPPLTLRRSSSLKEIIHTRESREDIGNQSESKGLIQTSHMGEETKTRRSQQNSDHLNLHCQTAAQRQSFQVNTSVCQQPSNLPTPVKYTSQAEPDHRTKGTHSKRLISGVLTSTMEKRGPYKGAREPKEPIDLSFMDHTLSYSPVKGKDSLLTKDSENRELERVDRAENSFPKKLSNDYSSKVKPDRKQREKKVGDICFDDIEDDIDEYINDISLGPRRNKQRNSLPLDSAPISIEAATELKQLIFGSPSSSFLSEWKKQSFSFSEARNLEYGIVQLKGGPCGVLAAVQANFLKFLLFEGHQGVSTKTLSLSVEKQRQLLAKAAAFILWRAGECQSASVTLLSTMAKFSGGRQYKSDGFTETLTIFKFKEYSGLLNFMTGNIVQWQGENSYGCILLLYSAIFSRGIKRIRQDMDEIDGTLLGSHGYCTQELVNLLLTGRAVSNVFDGIMELDSGGDTTSLLKGIEERADIGFLSLFEHYKSCEVGNNYKNPKFPIWVVCSESHFSVLFSTTFDPMNKSARKFDLYYYDGLALQDEEICLTVDLTKPWKYENTTGDLIPPLELCLRTKWTNCAISWNGTEPLL